MSTKIGLFGYGRAGQAVARVLQKDASVELSWVVCASEATQKLAAKTLEIPVFHNPKNLPMDLSKHNPVDAIIDFSGREGIYTYADFICKNEISLISAISSYTSKELTLLEQLGKFTRVMYSPNITLGINFLMIAAKLLRKIAPFADLAILEQHFRDKQEVSGTAKKLADALNIQHSEITSLRLGGIIGQHEVIFGFPYQTIQMVHNSISREAFGTGAIFSLKQLIKREIGFYTFESILLSEMKKEILEMA